MALMNLEGVAAETVHAPFFRTVTEAMRNLSTNQATCAADDYGAINAWKDDNGYLHASLYRNLSE